MSASHAEERALFLCAQRLLFAGKPILLRTNAPKIAGYVSDFCPADDNGSGHRAAPVAEITLEIHDEKETRDDESGWFRGRGEFAVAQFTPSNTLWFNLRNRTVLGRFTASMAEDRERWRRHIFPTLLGILAAMIDVVPVHAACLARGSRGILLAGPSGTGKSTLTVSLGKRGYAFLSDDWTCLTEEEAGVTAWGMSTPVKLLPDASRFFPELREYHAGISLNGETAYEVSPKTCFGFPFQRSCPVACVALLERSEKSGCHITSISAAEAITHLAAEIEPLEGALAACYRRQIALLHGLSEARCVRVCFHDQPDAVAEALDLAFSSLDNA